MKSKRAIAVLIGLTLGVVSIPILTTNAAVANPCRLPGGVLKYSDLAARSAIGCGAVGRPVDTGNGVSLLVQPPGDSVTLGLLSPTGERTYTLTTDAQGMVTAETQGPAASDASGPVASATQGPDSHRKADVFPDLPGPGACERDTYALAGFKWTWPWLYRTNIGAALVTRSQADFDAATRRATANITQGHNSCGLHDGIGATGGFIGHTTAHGNFVYADDQTTCAASDHQNVIDVGDLPGGFLEATLAAYCVWTETRNGVTRAVSADLRFNNGDYNWTYNPTHDPKCDPTPPADPQRWRYDVESVMTHEVGHVYGLVNLSDANDLNQTMYPVVIRCTGNDRSLGLGDMLGLRALYGHKA
jgi:hypothetical protein